MQQDVFSAIADPTRRSIMGLLMQSDKPLSEITPHFDMSRPAISKHIKILQAADLVEIIPAGRRRIHKLKPQNLKPVTDWLKIYDIFWDDHLGKLKSLIEGDTP